MSLINYPIYTVTRLGREIIYARRTELTKNSVRRDTPVKYDAIRPPFQPPGIRRVHDNADTKIYRGGNGFFSFFRIFRGDTLLVFPLINRNRVFEILSFSLDPLNPE